MKLILKFGKPKANVIAKYIMVVSKLANLSRVAECGSLHEIETNVNLMVQMKERFKAS